MSVVYPQTARLVVRRESGVVDALNQPVPATATLPTPCRVWAEGVDHWAAPGVHADVGDYRMVVPRDRLGVFGVDDHVDRITDRAGVVSIEEYRITGWTAYSTFIVLTLRSVGHGAIASPRVVWGGDAVLWGGDAVLWAG